MAADLADSGSPCALPSGDGPAARGAKIRVLFGATGWPSGVLEVASWAVKEEAAEAAIVQLRPDDALSLAEPGFLARLRDFAAQSGTPDVFFDAAGTPSDAVRKAVAAVGGPLLAKLIDFRPHVVGFRVESGQLERLRRIVAAVRLFAQAEIVLGGPTATSHPRELLDETGADYVFAGEAERTVAQFLHLARQRNSTDRQPLVPGLAYRYGGRTYVNTLPRDGYERTAFDTEPTACSKRLRCLRGAVRPVAEAELIAANTLDWSLLEHFTEPLQSLYFTGGRGCPGSCTFCAKLHGNEVRNKTAAQLLAEIEAADARVAEGRLCVGRWPLYAHVDDAALAAQRVAWAAIYDEDFLLDRDRAIRFFRLWDRSPARSHYRLSLQTNPVSLLQADGRVHQELLAWIDTLKPMIQIGAESFHPELLARWRKRHTAAQLRTALDALDRTRQDYTVFQLLTDYDSTPEELIESLRLLALEGYRRRRMRIASTAYIIPLYDSPLRKSLEFGGRVRPGAVRHFTDYERPQPGWMDPLVAELADLADAELHFALNLPERDGTLCQAIEAVANRLQREPPSARIRELCYQADRSLDQVREARFQAVM